MDAPGVEYFEIQAGGQALRAFRCDVYKCDLSPASCAQRFLAAQHISDGVGPGLPSFDCKHCPVGRCHAGVQSLKLKRKSACVRCQQWSSKLVRGLLCVSCYNRQQEALKGADRRGHPPKTVIRFWDHDPAREPGRIPAVYAFAVEIEGVGVREFIAVRPREALEQASRLYFKGEPLHMAVLNAAELGRAVPYLRHCHNATNTSQAA